LDSARAKIEGELREKLAAKQAYDQSQKFDDARQGGSGLADAARKAGVPTASVGPVTDKGLDINGQPNPALDDRILKAAFAQAAGQDGDLQDEGKGEYFALKVEKVLPPALPALADRRPQLTAAVERDELRTELKAKSNALMDEVRKGATMDKAAAEVGGTVVRQTGMERIKAREYQALGQEFLEGVFGVKAGELFAAGGQNGIYIAKVDAVRPGDPSQTARLLEAVRPRASAAFIKDQMAALETAAREDYKVTTNLAAARQALGVDPAVIAKSPAKAGAPAK
jgi:peptidyl-prolyl cis-trans isomerase D